MFSFPIILFLLEGENINSHLIDHIFPKRNHLNIIYRKAVPSILVVMMVLERWALCGSLDRLPTSSLPPPLLSVIMVKVCCYC